MIYKKLMNVIKIGIIAFIVLALTLTVLLISKSAVASVSGRSRYYTSIQIVEGDSLWGISEKNCVDGLTVNEYIEELCAINNIEKHANLQAGDYLTIYYLQ